MSHWYHPETGFLLDQVPYKDPKRQGQYRDATLADARPLGYLPSVTTILQLLAKPGLVRWQVEQGIKAAWAAGTWARPEEALEPETVKVIYSTSEEYTRRTQDFGTATHQWLNKKLRAVETAEIPPMIPGAEECADGLIEWFPQNGFEWEYSERTFVNLELGIAGSTDLLGSRLDNGAIGDTKTQEPPLTPYIEHGLQLAGYSLGLGLDPAVERWSFIADRLTPGEVKAHLWQDKGSTVEATNQRYDRMFLLLRDFWFLSTGYDPRSSDVSP